MGKIWTDKEFKKKFGDTEKKPKKKKQYSQHVIVEYHNGGVFTYEFVSNKPIDFDEVVEHFEKTEGWSEDRDSIDFVDKPMKIKI
jgi:hypothetical protein